MKQGVKPGKRGRGAEGKALVVIAVERRDGGPGRVRMRRIPNAGAVSHDQLDYYLDEFTVRFNRRHSRQRGLLFYRLLEGAVATDRQPYKALISESAA